MLTGNKAPSASNLDQWLKEHPGYEVVRSGGKVVTAKVSFIFVSNKFYKLKVCCFFQIKIFSIYMPKVKLSFFFIDIPIKFYKNWKSFYKKILDKKF